MSRIKYNRKVEQKSLEHLIFSSFAVFSVYLPDFVGDIVKNLSFVTGQKSCMEEERGERRRVEG